MPGKNKNTKSSSISRNLHWITRPSASIRDLALWGADVLGAPSHITNAVRDVSNRVANLPIIGLDAVYNYAAGNSSTWEDAFKEADTNPSALASAFEVFPITNTESNYSDAQLANQYELRKHSPGKPGQITHDGYRYINQGRYAGDVGIGNFLSPSKVNEWSIGQTSGIADEEGNTYTSDLFAYDTKDTNNVYLEAIKERKASPAMFLRGALGVVGAKGYDDGTNSATSIRTKIDTKAQKRAYDSQNKKAEGGSLRSSWDDLSLAEKSEMMKVAIKNGITDLSTIRQKYNEFAEGDDISDEQYYAIMEKVAEENNPIWNKQRIAEGGKPLSVEEDLIRILNDNSYDYRGFYNKYPPTAADANSHWTDEFKTAYHPTFSDQSKYSGKKSQYNPYGYRGGHWVGETFFPEIWQTADSNEFAEGGPEETYNVGYIPEVTIEAERKNNPYIYYDPWSGRYKGIGIGGQRIEYGEGFNPEGSILLPNAQAYENQRLIRAKQDDLNHTNAFANTIRNIALATTVAPMAGPLVEAAQAAAPLLAPGSKLWMNPVAKQLMASEIGGRAVDALFINGKTWGENLAPIVNEYTRWNPEETWWGKSLMEATNPGYLMSPTGLMSATGKAVDTAINTTKILSPRYRSLHAYNSINPVGYGSPVQRGLVWLDDMIKDNPVDIKRPLFYQRAIAENKGVRPDEGYLRTGDYLEPTVKNRGQISDEARLDAWAIHNNLEPQYGTYIKTGDREYAYNIPKLMEKSENTLSAYKLPKGNESGGKGMTDFVTGAGGGLTDFSLLGTDAHGNSLIHIEDLWDVNPFKRSTDIISRKLFPNWSSKYGNSLFTRGSRLYDFGEAHNSALLRRIGDKMMADSDEPLLGLLKPLDKKMQEFEVGTITGGKPFLMSTDVPVHAVSTPIHVSDDLVLPMTTYKFGYNPNYFVDKSAFEPNYNTISLEDVDLGNLFDNITTTNPVIPRKRR